MVLRRTHFMWICLLAGFMFTTLAGCGAPAPDDGPSSQPESQQENGLRHDTPRMPDTAEKDDATAKQDTAQSSDEESSEETAGTRDEQAKPTDETGERPSDKKPRQEQATVRNETAERQESIPPDRGGAPSEDGAVKVVANPQDVTVLVNKVYRLPDGYRPADLVEPNVPFIFSEKSEKRLLRKEAAKALEELFAAAKADGIHLAGVSGFRSQDTQKWLFEHYVKTRGEAEARRFSAMPGHSEHQTGLAMDVSGADGRCAAQDCFAGTKEALWLEQHAHEYGFIIRYPKGKEHITGYKYEPWHLRYVGKPLAQELVQSGLTLDEYLEGTVPVSN